MAALDIPYEVYEELNGGPNCGICGREPLPNRRNDRDHVHKGDGRPRGLLCPRCNGFFGPQYTADLLEAALAYYRRGEQRWAEMQAAA